jgi:uncharacterized protein (TIGR03437 family)
MQNLKRLLVILVALCATVYGLYEQSAEAFSGGPPAARTGAPVLGSAPAEVTCTACHRTNPLNDPAGTLSISAPDSYTPGTDVTVTVNIARGTLIKFGFQLTALDDQGNKAGDLVLTDTARTQLQTGGFNNARQYIAHTAAGNTATETGKNTWSFTWRPPAQPVGRVVFYAAGNATNSSNSNAGDFIYNTTKALYPSVFTPQNVASVSAASYTAGSAAEAIVALFGTGLASVTAAAAATPLPTQLGSVRVVVKDAMNVERDAPLFFVSPLQVNFQVPPMTANGNAGVTLFRDNTAIGTGSLTITNVAPALFTFNANGQGVPAAVAVRVKGGAQTTETIARLNGTTWEATPIDLGAEDEQVFLAVFGTGFRNRGTGGTLSATIGGTNSTNVMAAVQPEFTGLDQANILIPRSLIGRGAANVILTVNGQATNTVQINVK